MKHIRFIYALVLALFLPGAAAFADDCKTNARGEQVCVGNTVLDLDGNNRVGRVRLVNRNGMAQVVFPGRLLKNGVVAVRHVNRLSPSVRCVKNICAGERVLDVRSAASDTGVVRLVFAVGLVKVDMEGDRTALPVTRRVQDLSRSVRCAGNICVNDRVVDLFDRRRHSQGTVRFAFENNVLKVALDGRVNLADKQGLFTRTVRQVAKVRVVRPPHRPPHPPRPIPRRP